MATTTTVVENCKFLRNKAVSFGGAVYLLRAITSSFINSVFISNTSNEAGGAIALVNSGSKFTNCVITQNKANFNGGGVYNFRGEGRKFDLIVHFVAIHFSDIIAEGAM